MRDLFDDFVRKNPPIISEVIADILEITLDSARSLVPELVGKVDCNFPALYSALSRYARDAFGCQRISTIIERYLKNLPEDTPQSVFASLQSLHTALNKELKASGIRIASKSPYIQKKAAILLYHLILQRPFLLNPNLIRAKLEE